MSKWDLLTSEKILIPAIVAVITVVGSILAVALTPGSFLIHPNFTIAPSDDFKENGTNYHVFKITNNGAIQAKNVQINIDSIDKFSVDSNDNLHMLRLVCPESNFNSDNQWKNYGEITLNRLSVNVDCDIVLASKNSTQIFDITVTADNTPASKWFGATGETQILSDYNNYLEMLTALVAVLGVAVSLLPLVKSKSKTPRLQISLDSLNYIENDVITATFNFDKLASNDTISINIIDPENKVVDSKDVSFGIETGSRGVILSEHSNWSLEGTYKVKARSKQTGLTSIVSFNYKRGSKLQQISILNTRIIDSMGNILTSIKVGQKVSVVSDLINIQDIEKTFAYLLQIQDANGMTVSLTHVAGIIPPKKSKSASQDWTPQSPGKYVFQIFVWKNIDRPDALAPPMALPIEVV